MKGFRSKVYRQMIVVFIVCFFGIVAVGIYMLLTNGSIQGKAGGRIGNRDVTMNWVSVAILALFVLIAGIYMLNNASKDLNGK